MSERRLLPARRSSVVINFTHTFGTLGQQPLMATVSLFEDGAPAEVFVDPPKVSNDMANLSRDVGLLISIALQYGVPVEVMRSSVGRSEDGRPHSVAGSILDVI
jgi:hypothetical protein